MYIEREYTEYVPAYGSRVRPDTAWVLTTVPSASTAHTRCCDREYTTRRPEPEFAGRPCAPAWGAAGAGAGAAAAGGVAVTQMPRRPPVAEPTMPSARMPWPRCHALSELTLWTLKNSSGPSNA